MPRYEDDQCEECGAVRVARSVLSADCMGRHITRLEDEVMDKREMKKGLEKKVELLTSMLDDAVNYGFGKNQENTRLLKRCQELEESIIRRL